MNNKGDVLTVFLIWTAATVIVPSAVDMIFDVTGRQAEIEKLEKEQQDKQLEEQRKRLEAK